MPGSAAADARRGPPPAAAPAPKLRARGLHVHYPGGVHALKGVTLDVYPRQVLALVGPSGCGKSTFLRALNRMHDLTPGARVSGRVWLDGADLYAPDADPVELRRRVGMVFQRPNLFPGSIYANAAWGPRLHGARDVERQVVAALRRAGLWEEVRGRLHAPAAGLSGGQQQRLCLARALALAPEVLLLDEPTSALDPVAAARLEALVLELKAEVTVVMVTHNLAQARRVADRTAFFLNGELVEAGETGALFTRPADPRTADYVQGKCG